ncbi:MAG: zinc ribbon domain-containing protein [Ardenticatenales bacterium]|nr:zinc ribbon domain-containing protein [Ardenticatenales bacterium]
MPIYDYQCPSCKKRGSRLQKMSDPSVPDCPRCGTLMQKMISKVAVLLGEEQHMEKMADPAAWGDFDENDPRSLGRMMRRMGQEMGSDELGDEFREVVERLESGEDPEAIEADLPNAGGGGRSNDWLD